MESVGYPFLPSSSFLGPVKILIRPLPRGRDRARSTADPLLSAFVLQNDHAAAPARPALQPGLRGDGSRSVLLSEQHFMVVCRLPLLSIALRVVSVVSFPRRARSLIVRDSLTFIHRCLTQHSVVRKREAERYRIDGVHVGGKRRRIGGWGGELAAWKREVQEMVRAQHSDVTSD